MQALDAREVRVHEVNHRQAARGNLRGKRVDGRNLRRRLSSAPLRCGTPSAKDRELGHQLSRAALRQAAAMRSVSVIQTAVPSACTCCRAQRNGRSRNG